MSFYLPPPLAEIGPVERVVITILAVAGGFLIGFVLTHVVGRLLGKFVFKHETSGRLLRVARFAGGIAAAILVYMLLNGEGGLGLGGRGGGGLNPSPGESKEKTDKETPREDVKTPQKKDVTVVALDEQLIVYVLRADAPAKRFYQIGKDSQPLTLDDVLGRIDDRSPDGKKDGKKAVKLVRIIASDPDYSVQAATLLQAKLQERGIEATPPKSPRKG
jgi:hypothetical protein